MANLKKIIVTERSDDFHACLEGSPGIWGCGNSPRVAIGELIRTHPKVFGVEVVYPKKHVSKKPPVDRVSRHHLSDAEIDPD